MNRDQLAARLLATFVSELEEQIGVMNVDLLGLEAAPTDAGHLRSLFRVAHSLKGAASAANVRPIERACHTLETLLSEARDGRLILGKDEFALLFSAADALSDAGRRLREGRDLAGSPLAALALRLQTRQPGTPHQATPSAPASTVTLSTERGGGDGQVRIAGGKLDELLAGTGQLLIAGSRVASRPAELDALHDDVAHLAIDWSRTSRRLRLALERAGASPSLIQAVSGTEQSLRRLLQSSGRLATDMADDARALAHAAGEVADRARRLRMRPFAEACEALPRVVRDLAASSGKEIELEVVGGEVEADRAVLDGLREALLQLLRNAVDHGLEPPLVREQAGKPRRGRIKIAAALEGDRLRVTVADDGAGLDVAAVRALLERRGRAVPGDDRGVMRALFEGGLSTRTEATALSGRGVGLDIVRAAVHRIRGRVDLTWVPGGGTTFSLECPPTLATIRALLAAVGPHLIAIPSAFVERLLRLRLDEIRYAEGRAVIVTSGAPVPLVSLARLLPPLVERPVAGVLAVVLLRSGDRELAVAVDELLAEGEIVVRPVWRDRDPLPHVSGATILGSGRVALVVNPAAIVETGLALAAGQGVAVAEAKPGRSRPRVLVVDDSITTRTLERSILEAAGYDVLTAVDGADAWRVLQEQGSELVVADVEMPRMDGFGLCATIRGSKRFKELPVILVTALETPEHRARGLEAGADAYIGKSSFDQQRLLDTITQLVG